jgi:prepilin-type N-terminal cleavage/methylation domain-containing protein
MDLIQGGDNIMKLNKKRAMRGFTLIELMIVVAIIGILAAIAIPKFADLVNKSKESSVKGSLGAIRSAISIYYSDMEGSFPAVDSLAVALTENGKYLKEIPSIILPNPANHTTSTDAILAGGAPDDASGWYYAGPTAGTLAGHFAVNCTHTDTRSSVWSAW